MKFLRYFVLGTLILQSFGLTAMSSRQKAEVKNQIIASFGNGDSWFDDSRNTEGLRALINKLGTVEQGSQKDYLKLLHLKIETAQALKKSSSNTNTASVEIKIKKEDLTGNTKGLSTLAKNEILRYLNQAFEKEASWFLDSGNVESVKTKIAQLKSCEPSSANNYLSLLNQKLTTAHIKPSKSTETKIKTETAQSSSSSSSSSSSTLSAKTQKTVSNTSQIASNEITYDDARKQIVQKKALNELNKLAGRLLEDDKTFVLKKSDVAAIITKYASVDTKQTQEKQSHPNKPLNDELVNYYEAYTMLLTALTKANVKDAQKVRRAANNDLDALSKSKRTDKKDGITYLYKDDVSAIIAKHTSVETKHTKEKKSYPDESSPNDELITYTEATTMIQEAIKKAQLNDPKTVQEKSISDLNEISKSKRAVKKDNITYLHKDDVEEMIYVHVDITQYKEQRDKKIEEAQKEDKNEKKHQELQAYFNEGIAAGTLVKTPNGFIAIEKLKKDDYVESWDFSKGESARSKILSIEKRTTSKVIQFDLSHMGTKAKATVIVAPGHWFYTNIDRWIIQDSWGKAKNLKVGDMITDYYIDAIKEIHSKTTVYNLVLESVHNFRISKAQVVVHNAAASIVVELFSGGDSKVAAITGIAAASFGIIAYFKDMFYEFAKKMTAPVSKESDNSNQGQSGSPKPDPDDDDELENIIMDLERITLRYLDPAIGNLKKLEKAVNAIKNIPGAMNESGPIKTLFKTGIPETRSYSLGGASGAAYEIEAAYKIMLSGEEITSLSTKIASREVDIVTKTRLIECKNIDWSKLSANVLEKHKSSFGELKKIATELGKEFNVLSKRPIPDSVKEWLIKKGITFFEEYK